MWQTAPLGSTWLDGDREPPESAKIRGCVVWGTNTHPSPALCVLSGEIVSNSLDKNESAHRTGNGHPLETTFFLVLCGSCFVVCLFLLRVPLASRSFADKLPDGHKCLVLFRAVCCESPGTVWH